MTRLAETVPKKSQSTCNKPRAITEALIHQTTPRLH